MKFICLITPVLASVGCSTINLKDTRTVIEKAVPYVEPASYFACAQILDLSQSIDDRKVKAEIIYSISASIRSLSDGQIPTQHELENVIRLITPDKPHWVELSQSLGEIYQNLFEEVNTDRDKKMILVILGELAEGCERAAQPYVGDEFLLEYKIHYIKPFNKKKSFLNFKY